MNERQRVREARMFMQVATRRQFTEAVEEIIGRKVWAFSSAADPDQNVIFETFVFASSSPSDGDASS